MLIQRLPTSVMSHPDTKSRWLTPEHRDEGVQDKQTIFFSRGIAFLELAGFNRRNGLAGGGAAELTSALADLKRATALNPVRVNRYHTFYHALEMCFCVNSTADSIFNASIDLLMRDCLHCAILAFIWTTRKTRTPGPT